MKDIEQKLTTESPSIKQWLKRQDFICLETKPRGLQVKVRLFCKRHKKEFEASIHALQHAKGIPINYCPDCAIEKTIASFKSGQRVQITPNVYTNITALNTLFGIKGKYKHHHVIKYDQKTKRFLIKCDKTNKTFYTKNLYTELGFSRTNCEHCAQDTNNARLSKIKEANLNTANAKISKSKTYDYTWINGKRICNKCGAEIKEGRICRLCTPKKYTSCYKGYTAKQVCVIAKIRKKIKQLKRSITVLRRKNILFLALVDKGINHIRLPNVQALLTNKSRIPIASNNKIYVYDIKNKKILLAKPGKYFIKTLNLIKRKSVDKKLLKASLTHHYLTKEYISMAAKLGRLEIINRAKNKVSNYRDIELIGVNKSATKVKYKCTKHDVVYIKNKKNFFWSDYLCDKCRKENIGKNISKSLTGSLTPPKGSYLSIIDRHVKLTREQAHTLNTGVYGIKVKCSCCGSTYLTSAHNLKKTNFQCKVCQRQVLGARSYIANNWLKEMKDLFKLDFLQGCDSCEKTFRIKGKTYKVDGYHKQSKTVFEFLGAYWHGYQKEDQKFDYTFARLGKLSKHFTVVYVWEHDYLAGKPFSGVIGSITPLLNK